MSQPYSQGYSALLSQEMPKRGPKSKKWGKARKGFRSWAKTIKGKRSAPALVGPSYVGNTIIPVKSSRDSLRRIGRTTIEVQANIAGGSGVQPLIRFAVNSSTRTYVGLSEAVTGTASWGTLSAQYDQFRVHSVTWEYTPYVRPLGPGSQMNKGLTVPYAIVFDPDQLTLNLNEATILDYASAKIYSTDKEAQFTQMIKGFAKGASGGYTVSTPWFDTATPQMVCGCWGVSTVVPATATTTAFFETPDSGTNSAAVGCWVLTLDIEYRKAV